MIIVSKFKDYYDYLQGIVGRDEKIILDRTDSNGTNHHYSFIEKSQNETLVKVFVVIGTKTFNYFLFKNKAYTCEQLKKSGILIKTNKISFYEESYYGYEYIGIDGKPKIIYVDLDENKKIKKTIILKN